MLTRVDAYAGERLWIRRLEDLKLIREALGLNMPEWAGRNASDKELDDGMAKVERLRDRLRELMDRFEAMKLAALRGS